MKVVKETMKVITLAFAFFCMGFFSYSAEAGVKRSEAVAWAASQAGRTDSCDIDGNGMWCTDFGTVYMNFCWLRANNDYSDPWKLRNPYTTYTANRYPSMFQGNPNWTIITRQSDTVPEAGDLFVASVDSGGNGYGHIGVILEVYGSSGAKIIDMGGGVRPTIRTVTWKSASSGSYGINYYIRFNYFEPEQVYIPEYTISYDANGGTGAPGNQIKKQGENITLSSNKPSRSGYDFLGWSANRSSTTAEYGAGSNFTSDANTTLYAVWKKQAGSQGEIYGEWSSWSEVYPSDKEGREIESREVIVGYNLVTYLTMNASTYYREYRSFSLNGRYSDYGARSSYGEFCYTSYADKATLDGADQCHNGAYVAYGSGTNGYIRCDDTAYIGGGLDGTLPWFISNTIKKVEYRYRDRVLDSLIITGQPANARINKGTTANFKVTATGKGLKYQWQFMLAGKTGWTSWTGKTSATLSVPYDVKKNNMKVRCQITDSTGKNLTSNEAVLTYVNLFEITKQPVSVNAEEGHAAPFSVAVVGNGLKYQWQFKLASASGWKNWAGKTDSLLKVPYDAKKNGMLVRCVITNENGSTLTSGTAKLVYNGVAPSISRQPANTSVASGHAGVFSIGASGDTLSFQWQYKLAGTSVWKNWAGKTEATLKIPYDAKKNGMCVRCVVTDRKGNKLTSSAAVLNYTK